MRIRQSVAALLCATFLNGNTAAFANPSDGVTPVSLASAARSSSKDFSVYSAEDKKQNKREAKQDTKRGLEAPLVEDYLIRGKLAEGKNVLLAKLKENPQDDNTRFGLGILEFISALERLEQDLYKYGLRSLSTHGLRPPILRLPVEENPNPEVFSYLHARKMLETFRDNLLESEGTLAAIKDPALKVPLHFGLIKLDLNADGQASEEESLWKLYANISGNTHLNEGKKFYIAFDRGDVHWMRGYCHLISSLCDVYLAHDSKETFECTAHMFFSKVDSPYKFLKTGKRIHRIGRDDMDLVDLIALVHLIRWEVIQPERMEAALHHLEAVVAQSKESWKFILAENDDDHEWVPNPRQTGVMPNMHVTDEMVTSWSELMDHFGKVLAGELLIPFWRGDGTQGVNVREAFLKPGNLDLVLWVQGPAAAPYLQKGKLFTGDSWREMRSAFGSNFPGFAVFFN